MNNPKEASAMDIPLEQKSSVEEIRERFDHDVERFSNLDSAQVSIADAPLLMELITAAAIRVTPDVRQLLDIGCGAGNNTLKLLQLKRGIDCDLLDLSRPMLLKAQERVQAANSGKVRIIQADFRTAELADGSYDVILAAAVLHHLRDTGDWETAFRRLHRLLRPGGSVWITDLVCHEIGAVQQMMWQRHGAYLAQIGGETYRQNIFDNVAREDSPRSVVFQLELLKKAGFAQVELLHKNSCFAAFGAVKRA